MKKIFILMALGSSTFIGADQYRSCDANSCSSTCESRGRNYSQREETEGRQRLQSERRNDRAYDQEDRDRNNKRNVSDKELSKKIEDTLSSGWFSKGFDDVSFDVNNGNVVLRGSVDSQENKKKVEDNIRKIDGVKQVRNQITIDRGDEQAFADTAVKNSDKKFAQDEASTSQDKELNARIRDKLNGWFSPKVEMLVLKTKNGMVTIIGVVEKQEDIQKVNEQVKNVDGVKSVNNQVVVRKS